MAMKNDFKVLWRDIKRSPGLLIALIVVIIAVLYFVYKQNNPATDTATNTPTQSPYRIETISITPPASTGGGTTDTPTDTGTGTTHSQLVTSTTGWLASTPGGTNNKGQNIMNLPSGAVLNLLSGPVSFGNNKYYKVSYQGKSGYVNAKTVGLA